MCLKSQHGCVMCTVSIISTIHMFPITTGWPRPRFVTSEDFAAWFMTLLKHSIPRPPSRHQRLVHTVAAGEAECIPIVMLNLINFQIEPPPLPRRQHSQIEHLILCRECDCDCSKQQEYFNSTSSLFFPFCLQYDQVYSKTLNT